MSKVSAIVLAAGNGSRMQSRTKKQFMEILGKPVLWYSLFQFEQSSVEQIILVTAQEDIEYCKTEIVDHYGFKKVRHIVAGGKERYHSVINGLEKATGDIVLIHDGARPLIEQQMIADSIACAKLNKACAVGVPVKDTIKIVEDSKVVNTPERSRLWMIQTPQTFHTGLIREAYKKMIQSKNRQITDDAMVVEQYTEIPVYMVEGKYTNIRITTPEDIVTAEVFLKKHQKVSESIRL